VRQPLVLFCWRTSSPLNALRRTGGRKRPRGAELGSGDLRCKAEARYNAQESKQAHQKSRAALLGLASVDERSLQLWLVVPLASLSQFMLLPRG
jgi:hypothetical protein